MLLRTAECVPLCALQAISRPLSVATSRNATSWTAARHCCRLADCTYSLHSPLTEKTSRAGVAEAIKFAAKGLRNETGKLPRVHNFAFSVRTRAGTAERPPPPNTTGRSLFVFFCLLLDQRVLVICRTEWSVLQEVSEGTPCLFLVALDRDELKTVTGRGGGAGGVARLWLLVAWIPDDSKVHNVSHFSVLSSLS